MLKIILFSAVLFIYCGTSYYSQTSSYIESKSELLKYEMSFSSNDYTKVVNMEPYVTSITISKNINFYPSNNSIIISTEKELSFNIIEGKFRKKGVELLTFTKL